MKLENAVFLVAHPDDVANGLGGLALLLSERCALHVLCATRGERGRRDWSMQRAAEVREAEERAACELLGAQLTFLDRVDREVFADEKLCRRVADLLQQERPQVVVTIWPVDHHPDHAAISEVARKAVWMSGLPIEILYGEEGDSQTRLFTAGLYVDISRVMERKLELIRCHVCQNADDRLATNFQAKARRIGAAAGLPLAEAYCSHRPVGHEGPSLLLELPETIDVPFS